MIRMDLGLFGGRGGDATSARWMDGFFKYAKRGAHGEDDVLDELDAARMIYRRMMKAKNEGKVTPSGGFDPYIEGRVLEGWTKSSGIADFDSDSGDLNIDSGKLAQARREFERYLKQRYKSYYNHGRPAPKRGVMGR
jgi:hypothetical protein